MGGFVTRDGHPIVIRKEPQLDQYLKKIEKIKEEDIKDKSKKDVLSKLLTALQVIWFVGQYIVRHKEHLPISPLETATLGFAFIHICTSGFWMMKPQDVSEAILIDFVGPNDAIAVDSEAESQLNRSILAPKRQLLQRERINMPRMIDVVLKTRTVRPLWITPLRSLWMTLPPHAE
jgi:hypothetical protein